MGQIFNKNILTTTESTWNPNVDEKSSSRIGISMRDLNLGNKLTAIGCSGLIEVDGIEIEYYDPYDSLGKNIKIVDSLAGSGVVYIDPEYSKVPEIRNESIVVTGNEPARVLFSKRPLIAVIKDETLIADDENLKPFVNELGKSAEQVEQDSASRRARLRLKLLGESTDNNYSTNVISGVLCVFGAADK